MSAYLQTDAVESTGKLWICVTRLSGRVTLIDWSEDLTVDQLKQHLLLEDPGTSGCCQRLLFRRKLLVADAKLRDIGVGPYDVFHYYVDCVCPHSSINL